MEPSTRNIASGVFWGLVLFFIVLPLSVGLTGLVIGLLIGAENPVARLPPAPEDSASREPPPAPAPSEIAGEGEDPGEAPPEPVRRRRREPADNAVPREAEPQAQPDPVLPPAAPEPPAVEPAAAEDPDPAEDRDLGPLGARLADLSTLDDERRAELEIPPGTIGGVLVVEVLPESAAFRAGIQQDDLLTHVGGARLRDLEQIERWLRRYGTPGALGQLQLSRRVDDRNRRLVRVLVRF
ncbi:MAG: PDZ domain-containing protein [Pirellulales bacterium]